MISIGNQEQQNGTAAPVSAEQTFQLTAKLINDIGEYLASRPWRETNNLIVELRRQCFVWEQEQRAKAEQEQRAKAEVDATAQAAE